jgi:uncharacterized membrane protein
MTSSKRLFILVAAAVGLASSLTSTYVHYRLLTEPGFTSFCDVSATVSCTEAYLSQYGSFLGVPVAIFGTAYFVAVLGLAGLGGRQRSSARDAVPGYIFVLSTIALAFVLYLAYAAFFILNAFCILCAITYVAVVAIFIVSGTTSPVPASALPGRLGADANRLAKSPAALAILALVVVGTSLLAVTFPNESAAPGGTTAAELPPVTADQRAQLAQWWDLQPRVDVPVAADGATVVIVKFNDYQCPPCRQTYENYKGILAKYRTSHPGAVRFVTKDFPLDPECNFNAPNGAHLAACEAAVAVRLAEKQNRREAMEDWLFANQPQLTPDLVKEGARTVGGVNVSDFNAQYPKVLPLVKADIASGGALGVRSTPTFFINGRLIKGGLPPQFFDAAVAYELKQAKR